MDAAITGKRLLLGVFLEISSYFVFAVAAVILLGLGLPGWFAEICACGIVSVAYWFLVKSLLAH
jgi:hypothetical protein